MLLRARKSQNNFKFRYELSKREAPIENIKRFNELFIVIPRTWCKKDAERLMRFKALAKNDLVLI